MRTTKKRWVCCSRTFSFSVVVVVFIVFVGGVGVLICTNLRSLFYWFGSSPSLSALFAATCVFITRVRTTKRCDHGQLTRCTAVPCLKTQFCTFLRLNQDCVRRHRWER